MHVSGVEKRGRIRASRIVMINRVMRQPAGYCVGRAHHCSPSWKGTMGQWGRSFPPGVTRYTLYKGRPLMGGPRPLTPCLAKFLFSTGRPPVQPVHAHGKRLLRSTPFPALHAYIYIYTYIPSYATSIIIWMVFIRPFQSPMWYGPRTQPTPTKPQLLL